MVVANLPRAAGALALAVGACWLVAVTAMVSVVAAVVAAVARSRGGPAIGARGRRVQGGKGCS